MHEISRLEVLVRVVWIYVVLENISEGNMFVSQYVKVIICSLSTIYIYVMMTV
jgi:hypothetical protein